MLQWCRLFKRCQNLPAKHDVEGVKAAGAVLEPTCSALCCRGAGCLSGVRPYLLCTVLRWCRVLKRCWNHPAGPCVAGCLSSARTYLPDTVLQVADLLSSVGTYLWGTVCRGAGCLSGVRTFLQSTVGQGCRLFKQCRNLPAKHDVEGVKAAGAVLEPTCSALCCRGAGCLSGVRPYLLCTVLRWCRVLKRCWNHPAGPCVAGCLSSARTYLPDTVLQVADLLSSVGTYLWGTVCRGAGCLSGVRTFLQSTVGQGCRLFKQCRNLPSMHCGAGCRLFNRSRNQHAGHCVAGVQAV